jgi:two-component system, OmpR family, response regulator PhoP
MNVNRKTSVVVLEDDRELRDEIVLSLQTAGLHAMAAPNGNVLEQLIAAQTVDVVVLDIGLSKESGLDIAQGLLHHPAQIGIIMLTGRGTLDDRVAGMRAGADGYLVKPADPRELIAMIEACMRRRRNSGATDSPSHAVWQLSQTGWTLHYGQQSMKLTSLQHQLMECFLIAPPGQPLQREHLMRALDYDPLESDPHRLETLIHRLRQKCREHLGADLPLLALPKRGYVFDGRLDRVSA